MSPKSTKNRSKRHKEPRLDKNQEKQAAKVVPAPQDVEARFEDLQPAEVSPVSAQPKLKRKIGLLDLLFILSFTLFLILSDSYIGLERKVSDFLADFICFPPKEKQVVIVAIDDETYTDKKLFDSKSPLNGAVVTKIINAISAGEPKVLGVNLNTEEEDVAKDYELNPYSFPIVWAEQPELSADNELLDYTQPLFGRTLSGLHFGGLTAIPRDSDGIRRYYQRSVAIKMRKEESHPTFAWKVYELAYPREASTKTPNNDKYYIRYTGRKELDSEWRLTLSAARILEEFDRKNTEELKGWLKDKIVILGGMHRYSNDKSMVPYGEMYGVELNSSIIETELLGEPQKVIPEWLRMAINLIMILLFTFNFFRFGFTRKSFCIAISVSCLLGIMLSLLQYGTLSGVPMAICVFIYGLFIAIFDLLMDKYKGNLASIFDRVALRK